jgi:hypothetical protein
MRCEHPSHFSGGVAGKAYHLFDRTRVGSPRDPKNARLIDRDLSRAFGPSVLTSRFPYQLPDALPRESAFESAELRQRIASAFVQFGNALGTFAGYAPPLPILFAIGHVL